MVNGIFDWNESNLAHDADGQSQLLRRPTTSFQLFDETLRDGIQAPNIKKPSIEEKFIFVDSINTLQLFNMPGTVARFVYFLAGKIREWKIKGVIISIKKGTDLTLLNELAQFCDIEIDLGGK